MQCPAKILVFNSDLSTWQLGAVDLLANNLVLDQVCYIFLEDGPWFKGENRPEREGQRRKILKPFQVPNFVSSQLCTDLNGYCGSQSSLKTVKASPNSNDDKEELETLVTWFRVLTKKALGSEEPRAPGDKDYWWYEMDFFARWSGADSCRVLCVDTPQDVRERLEALLEAAPKLELRDPFAMIRPLLDEVIRCCDDSTWRMTNQVRKVEKNRHEIHSFEILQNLLRHVYHLVEVENVAVETMKQLVSLQEACFKLLPPNLTNTYKNQAKEYMVFQLQMMKSLKWRTEATHQRLQGEINLAFNMLASIDNQIMKSITLLTMVFLPAAFIATMFSTPFFSFTESGLEFSKTFWIYWVVVVPLTLAVVLVWWRWLGGSYKNIKAGLLHMPKARLDKATP